MWRLLQCTHCTVSVLYILTVKGIRRLFHLSVKAISNELWCTYKNMVNSSLQNSCQSKTCGLVRTNSTLIKWDITDLHLLQIEKYTLADRWMLKFFLNCLNACFFGNLTNTRKRESRGEREKRRWKVLKKHIMNVNYSSNTGLCFFWANIINIFVW